MFATTRMALLIGGSIGGATFPLFAQETTKNDTVIVTSPVQSGATKLATPDIETPQSVSIITRQQFEEQGATSVRQAVSYTPGVYSNQIAPLTALITSYCVVFRTVVWITSISTG